MEKLKALPFYKRFGFRVLLFNALLLFSIIAPSRIIIKADYKNLMNRITFHGALFDYCTDRLSRTNLAGWPAAIEGFPGVFYQQRMCVFTVQKELLYDSGIMREFDRDYMLDNLLPHPYIDWAEENKNFKPEVYIDYLTNLDLSGVDPSRVFRSTRTVRYDAGLDRIILSGKLLASADGKEAVFTMSDSIVDILIGGRTVKERFLFLYCSVAVLALGLTAVLSLSVTSPLKRLYRYSMEILTSPYGYDKSKDLPLQGEIGHICRALKSLIHEQKEESGHFQRFSSDVVHELKTPLSALRSGFELYCESADEREKNEIAGRIHKRLQQMEGLMNEIEHLGKLESRTDTEYTDQVMDIVKDVVREFEQYKILLRGDTGPENLRVPLSSDKVYQVLTNLLKNAVSFSPEKGSVELSVFKDSSWLCIKIQDRGPGISKEAFPHITDRFYSFRPKQAEKHSGLGLAIVQAILFSCKGKLTYSNAPSGGAEFTCRIPIVAKAL